MRIWSLHPKYLDSKGLVALWRETLLAKHVLLGLTKGYRNHPQLIRFKACEIPVHAIDQYLTCVYNESLERGYNFNKSKINWSFKKQKLSVTHGQLEFEKNHLENKLKLRDLTAHKKLINTTKPETHPIFTTEQGEIEPWEII